MMMTKLLKTGILLLTLLLAYSVNRVIYHVYTTVLKQGDTFYLSAYQLLIAAF
jgi:hypothetical protein